MEDFDRIYSDYYDAVYSYALRLTRDRHMAEEVTQEAFFKALKKLDSFRGECQLRVWLCQIAKNTYYTLLEKRRRTTGPPGDDWPDSGDLEARFEDKEAALAVHRALHGLPEPYREIFWLRALGELSFAQIGGLFGKTESWARVTYHRAKLKLREQLEHQDWI